MSQDYANAFGTGLAGPSQIQANLTKSAISKATREQLDTQKKKSTYDSNLEALTNVGIFTEETDGTIVLAPDAMDKLDKLSDGNRTQVSNALLMNEMMGTYHAETPDGQLEKKRNQQVFAPVLAKEKAVPFSIEQAADAGDANAIKLKKQYEDGELRGYVTPAINQEGLFSLLNVFGSDKKDDKPQVATKEEILTGLQARADKMNIDGDILIPDRSRAIRNQKKQNQMSLSNIGGGSDEGMIELVNGVFDENVNRGTTNSFLKNLQTMYAANPRYTVESKPASSTDTSIEVGSEQDVMVNTQGAAKTFEQAYPSLQGLDGERLATELENLQESGQLDNFGDQQKEQIFTDLKEQGIGSIPDLMKKRQEQKISAQEQYKEILMLNTVAARPDANGKLVLPDGKTPKEATNNMFNAYYTGSPDATLKELATAQNARRTSIRADQTADNKSAEEKRLFYTATTARLTANKASALAWSKQTHTEKVYYDGVRKEANATAISRYDKNQADFTKNTNSIKQGTYAGGKTFSEVGTSLRNAILNSSGDLFTGGLFGSGRSDVSKEDAQAVRVFQNELNSITKSYYDEDSKGGLGSTYVKAAKEAFLANAGTDEELKEKFEKMWAVDGHNIYTYNYAQPAGYLEHKFMQEEFILQKVFENLENNESLWNTVFGILPGIGESAPAYIRNIIADDAKGPILLNSLKDSMAVVYVDGNPTRITAIDAKGTPLEDGVSLTKLAESQGVSGLELNWLLENLMKIGDTDEDTDEDTDGDTGEQAKPTPTPNAIIGAL